MSGVSFEVVASMDQAMSTVKSGVGKINSYVSSLSKNQVDWTDMLTGALDPASIIGAITTLFSTAVLSTGAFQASLQNSSADAASSFGDNLGAATGAAISLSEKTGISAEDAASTLANLSAAWTDTNMQMAIGGDAATLAAAGLGKASEIAQQFSAVLKTFGVNDVPTANLAMQALYTAARNSGMSFTSFMSEITTNGPALQAQGISIQDAANALAAFATQSGQTAATASSAFNTITQALANTAAPGHYLLEGIQGVSAALAKGDIAMALTDIEKRFLTLNPATIAFGQAAGFSMTEMDAMHDSAVADLQGINVKAKELADTEASLGTNLDAPMTGVAKLEVAWNQMATSFMKATGPMASTMIDVTTQILGAAKATLDWGDNLETTLKQLANAGGIFKIIEDGAKTAKTASDGVIQDMNDKLLQTVMTGVSSKTGIGGIDNSHIGKLLGSVDSNKDSDLMNKLIDALKTGNVSETNSVSNELNLNIGTINSNSKPADVEKALYQALFNKFAS